MQLLMKFWWLFLQVCVLAVATLSCTGHVTAQQQLDSLSNEIVGSHRLLQGESLGNSYHGYVHTYAFLTDVLCVVARMQQSQTLQNLSKTLSHRRYSLSDVVL